LIEMLLDEGPMQAEEHKNWLTIMRKHALRLHALLDKGIREMEQLLARRKADGANFLDGNPKELLPGLHYLGDADGSAMYCLATAKDLILVDAPVGATPEFLAARFKDIGWAGRKPTVVMLTSADGAATAGLAAIVKETGCKVVAPSAGRDAVRRICPAGTEILTEQDLEKSGWFNVQAIRLQGRGLAPLAYQVVWEKKTVVISGRIPVKLDPPTAQQLVRDVFNGGDREQFLKSLGRLGQIEPDLWLPAVPVHGQNANVYDREWADVLFANRKVLSP